MNNRKYLRYATSVLALVGLWFVSEGLIVHYDQFSSLSWDLSSVFSITLAIAYWVLLFVIGASVWPLFLRAAGITVPFRDILAIQGKAQIGKYIPGNIFHYVSRVGLGVEAGIPADITVGSMGAETLVAVLTAVIIVTAGALGSLADGESVLPAFLGRVWSLRLMVIFSLAAGGTGLVFLNRVARSWILSRSFFFQPRAVVGAAVRYSFFFITSGIVINMLCSQMFKLQSPYTWFDASWRFSAAWLLGFLVPGAPGGLGVREAVFLALFGPGFGTGIAAAFAVALRLITVIADCISFVLGVLLARRTPSIQ